MSNSFLPKSSPDHLLAFFQAAQEATRAISVLGISDSPDRALLIALAAAGDNMDRCLKAVQDAMFRSIARPIPVSDFDTFGDNYGEING